MYGLIVLFFTDFTWKVFNTLCVKSNIFFHQITNFECELHEAMVADDIFACDMMCKIEREI